MYSKKELGLTEAQWGCGAWNHDKSADHISVVGNCVHSPTCKPPTPTHMHIVCTRVKKLSETHLNTVFGADCVLVCGLWWVLPWEIWGRWSTRARVSPDWLCHLLISCHGELVGPSLLEVCPRGPAALPGQMSLWRLCLQGVSGCACGSECAYMLCVCV